MHVCTSQLVLPIAFIVHLFNIVFYLFLLSIWTIIWNKVLLLLLLLITTCFDHISFFFNVGAMHFIA